MWFHVVLEQTHFIGNIFVALVLFGASWLYFDAWLSRHAPKEFVRTAGFIFVSLGFLLHATHIESPLFTGLLLGGTVVVVVSNLLLAAGYAAILISLIMDPLPQKPKTVSPFSVSLVLPPIIASGATFILPPLQGVLALLTGGLYLIRATRGLEKHLRLVALTFFCLGISHVLSVFSSFRTTTNVSLFEFVAPFGPVWIVEHVFLLIAALILGRWVFGYLLKRFESQIFMITTAGIVFVFLVTSLLFTTILLYNVKQEALEQLTSNAKVLSYALDSKKGEMLADAEVLAITGTVKEYIGNSASRQLRDTAEEYLLAKKLSTLLIVDPSGRVLARGEDKERFGDSVSGDPLFVRVRKGESSTSILPREGVLTEELLVRAGVPVMNGSEVVGVIMVSTLLDNAFVDGIKRSTGLESTVYAGDRISATTLVASDGITRPVGVRQLSGVVLRTVLAEGQVYAGESTFLGKAYLVSFFPIADADNQVVGMLFAGRPEEALFATAGRSFELSFIAVVVLLALSVFPSYAIARYISSQIK